MVGLALLLAAAPVDGGRYLMSLDGVPVGIVAWRLEGTKYTYTSTHAYRARTRVREVTLRLDELKGRVPEVLALARSPAVGCVDAVEELTGRAERVCIDAVEQRRVRGRIVFSGSLLTGARQPLAFDATAFTAEYGGDGRLARLEVQGAVFVASKSALPEGEDPFKAGFPVAGEGAVVSLAPELDGARQVAPRGAGKEERLSKGASCLELARERAAADASLELVVGLVVEDGRAWPHSWLRVRKTGDAVDPSVLPGDSAVARRRYLSLPADQAGAVFLELLAGTRKVTLAPR